MKNILFPRGCDSAKVIQVIQTKSARGAGTKNQPCRIVTEYWSLEGQKLAEADSQADGQQEDGQASTLSQPNE